MTDKYVDIAPINQLTHDRETSIRLYKTYCQKYSDKSPQWVVEKVIEDLLRDRGVDVRKPKGTPGRKFYPSGRSSTAKAKRAWPKMTPTRQTTPTRRKMAYKPYVASVLPKAQPVRKAQAGQALGVAALVLIGLASISQNFEGRNHNLLDFPPPSAFEPLAAGSQITIHNRVPARMTINLKGAGQERYQFSVAPCANCGTNLTPQEGSRLCDTPGPSLTFTVPPGAYDARVTFAGYTRGFISDWVVSDKWHHGQCVFSTYGLY